VEQPIERASGLRARLWPSFEELGVRG
jgi:hypothetical protein